MDSKLPAVSLDAFDLESLRQHYDPSRLDTVKRSPKRSLNATHDAFDLIGGVPRLAHWAHHNPGEFFTKIWGKTLQSNAAVEHSGEIVIRTAIPRTPLDGEWEDAEAAPSDE